MKEFFSDHEPVISALLAFVFSGLVLLLPLSGLVPNSIFLCMSAIILILLYFFLRERSVLKKITPVTKFVATIRDCSNPYELLFTVNMTSILSEGSLFLLSECVNDKETVIALGEVTTINSKGLYQATYKFIGSRDIPLNKNCLIIIPSIKSDTIYKYKFFDVEK